MTVGALRRGCRRTQERVYHAYASAAWTLAVRLSGCEADSWDVVQNSFIKAFSKIDQLHDAEQFGGWLRCIVTRQVLDLVRGRGKPAHDAEEAVAGANTGLIMDLEKALDTLSETDRVVLWLHDVEGMTHPEIADVLEQSIPWSKTRLSRARARARQSLLEHGVDVGRTAAHG